MQSHVKLQSAWVVLLDLLCLLISIVLAIVLRFGQDDITLYVWQRLDGWMLFVSSILIANYMAGSYRIQYTFSRFNMLVTWLFSISFAMFLLSVTSYAWFRILLGRGVFAMSALFYSVLSLYLRLVIVRAVFSASGVCKRVVILGRGPTSRLLRNYLENPFILPRHQLVAWVTLCNGETRRPAQFGMMEEGVPVIEAVDKELPDVVQGLNADLLVLSPSMMPRLRTVYKILRTIRFSGVEIMTPLTLIELYCGRISLEYLEASDSIHFGLDGGFPMMFRLKRVMDLAFALVLGTLTLPLMLLTAVMIKITEPRSPVLYSQVRVGQFGNTFTIHKFRTMRADAEEQTGAVWSEENDPRITTLGRWLRMFRLDELPQLWNVLMGEMSLVGPRPERPEITDSLDQQIPFYSEREYVLPGVTGWAQIHYPYGNTVEAARRKLEYDLYYIKNMSLSLDLQIILRTLRTVCFGRERKL